MNHIRLTAERHLIGQPGSRLAIDTPALVLDLDPFEANLTTMARLARERGVALRPHAKTHKSVTIARAQLAAGAVGLCCAKLSEAEVFGAAGIDHLLITSAVCQPGKVRRLAELNARLEDLAVAVETAENVRDLNGAVMATGRRLKVLIDVDLGTHRFGITTTEAAVALARLITEQPHLEFMGLQGYIGHVQAIPDYAERRRLSHAGIAVLGRVRDAVEAAGYPCRIVTGSGTGTHDFDHEPGVFTEFQTGSYIFMDTIYDEVDLTGTGERRFVPSLFVYNRIVSSQHDGFATTDAGLKTVATDGPPPKIAWGMPPGTVYGRFGDEFGCVELPTGAPRPAPDTLLACIVPHCDPNVNLFDWYHCVRGDRLVDLWPIEARGCAS